MNTVLYFRSNEETSASELLLGVREMAERARLHVQTVNFLPTAKQARDLVACWQPCGIIVECGGFAASLKAKLFAPLPVVFLDVDPRTLPPNAFAVYHDSFETGVMAARELLMSERSTYAYVDEPVRSQWSDERYRGFVRTLSINGYKATAFRASARTEANPIAYQRALRDFLSGLPVPAAVFASTDTAGADVIAAAEKLGRAVPADLAVVGVNDSESICLHTRPTLSSIRPDFRGGGTTAAVMLVAAIRAKGRFVGSRRRTFGNVDVIRRTSTRTLLPADPRVTAALETIRREAATGLTSSEVVRRHFACSRQFAERLFQKETGHSILDEIHAVQLGLAKRYLANPNQQLKQIAGFCGFRNPNSLRKFFLRETGQTMTAWRAALR